MTVTNRVRKKTREIPGEARHKIAAAPGALSHLLCRTNVYEEHTLFGA